MFLFLRSVACAEGLIFSFSQKYFFGLDNFREKGKLIEKRKMELKLLRDLS